MASKRKAIRTQREQRKRWTQIGLALAGLILVGALTYSFWNANQPPLGVAMNVMPDASHVPEGTDPGPYSTDPPTSGKHYEESAPPGFYEADDIPGEYPEGHLVHSLEHGYVIFWYNCANLDEQGCTNLKDEIRGVMDAENNNKVIAYPWDSIEEEVVLTSWGQMLRMEQFDARQAREFVRTYRNRSPEPNAP